MSRKHISPLLSAYHHHELTASENSRVEAHLKACSECQAAYEEIKLGVQLASALTVSAAPDFSWASLNQTNRESKRTRWIPIAGFVGTAASLILFILLRRNQPAPT